MFIHVCRQNKLKQTGSRERWRCGAVSMIRLNADLLTFEFYSLSINSIQNFRPIQVPLEDASVLEEFTGQCRI